MNNRKEHINPLYYPSWICCDIETHQERPLTREECATSGVKYPPQLIRHAYFTLAKNGAFRSAMWPSLMMNLVEVGLRKRSLSYRKPRARNVENTLRYAATKMEVVSGVINTQALLVRIAKELMISKTTMYEIIRDLCIMGIFEDCEYSSGGAYDLINGGRLPRTIKTTSLFFEILAIDKTTVEQQREFTKKDRAKKGKAFDPKTIERDICRWNTYRVWESRHTQQNSSYRVKLADMAVIERERYIAEQLVKRIKEKKLQIKTTAAMIAKMAKNLLNRMGMLDAEPIAHPLH